MSDVSVTTRQLLAFVAITLKGGLRDRVVAAMLAVGLLLLLSTPVVAVFSMRQVVALAASYSLSVMSLMGLLLTLSLAISLLARDLEQRTVYTVCSSPISRSTYVLGKFLGLAILLLLALAILACFSGGALLLLEHFYPTERPFAWGAFLAGLWFQYWVFLLVAGITVLFSTVATSTFLPLALSVGIYFASYSTEAVRYFVHSAAGQGRLGPAVSALGAAVYWLLPNFSAFDLKTEIVYGLPMSAKAVLLTQVYGVAYLGVLLLLSALAFSRREFL
jgi:ABC-type transport system involved in multi-copper enzyme maturation permease subunit